MEQMFLVFQPLPGAVKPKKVMSLYFNNASEKVMSLYFNNASVRLKGCIKCNFSENSRFNVRNVPLSLCQKYEVRLLHI